MRRAAPERVDLTICASWRLGRRCAPVLLTDEPAPLIGAASAQGSRHFQAPAAATFSTMFTIRGSVHDRTAIRNQVSLASPFSYPSSRETSNVQGPGSGAGSEGDGLGKGGLGCETNCVIAKPNRDAEAGGVGVM